MVEAIGACAYLHVCKERFKVEMREKEKERGTEKQDVKRRLAPLPILKKYCRSQHSP